ncbi:MAG TPA: FAD:protein FMN transferase [Deltaproteobacteria bacterium]|nr:FAD:protein FMN transferase [Deltaproteobacteria bacterium]
MLLLLVGACTAPAGPVLQRSHGEAMGTTWSVSWLGPVPDEAEAEATIVATLQQIDEAMSTWRDDSELAAVRRGSGPVAVGEETYAVVRAALQLAEATGGAFDPTVEPLMELWGFRGNPRTAPPGDEAVAEALGRIGWGRIALERIAGVPHVDAGGTALDLSAIAKGHAVDRVSGAMSALGAIDHLVELGGEVRAHGHGPSGAWRLGVDQPVEGSAPGARLAATVRLINAGLATSGNYRNTYVVDGVRLAHTMDPRTGRPHASTVLSASVIAPDCRTADGWATALMVLEPGASLALIEARPGLEAMLLLSDGGAVIERSSSGASAWFDAPPLSADR